MAPGWPGDTETATTASAGDYRRSNATTSKWFVLPPAICYFPTHREEPEPLIMKKEKQTFGKPLTLIGISLPIQKAPYLNHRRNSVRL